MLNHDYRDFNELSSWFVGKIAGAFSSFDMEGLKTGTDRLKRGDTYVEVGTQNGRSAYSAATMLPKGVKMFAVDITDASTGPDTMSRADFFKEYGLDEICTFIHAASHEAAKEWKGKIDMLFIDADHSYEGVKLDVDSWSPFLKSGGYIYFHDADATSPGVEKLVRQLGRSKNYDKMHFYRNSLKKNTSMASVRKK